jgi:hypothetical protein
MASQVEVFCFEGLMIQAGENPLRKSQIIWIASDFYAKSPRSFQRFEMPSSRLTGKELAGARFMPNLEQVDGIPFTSQSKVKRKVLEERGCAGLIDVRNGSGNG